MPVLAVAIPFGLIEARNFNKVPALFMVTQRPKELTREDLWQLKLHEVGFTETSV